MGNRKAFKNQQQLDVTNTAMENMKIPKHLQIKVRGYVIYTQATKDQQ